MSILTLLNNIKLHTSQLTSHSKTNINFKNIKLNVLTDSSSHLFELQKKKS